MQIRVLIKPTVCKCNIFTNRSLLHTHPHLWSPKRNQLHYSFSFLPYSSYQVFKINFPSPHEKKVIGCAEWLRYMSVSVNKQQIGMYDGSLKMLTLFIRKDIFTTCVIIFEEMPPHMCRKTKDVLFQCCRYSSVTSIHSRVTDGPSYYWLILILGLPEELLLLGVLSHLKLLVPSTL